MFQSRSWAFKNYRHLWQGLRVFAALFLALIPGSLHAQAVLDISDLSATEAVYPEWQQWLNPLERDDIQRVIADADIPWDDRSNHVLPLQEGPHWARLSIQHSKASGLVLYVEDQWVPTNFIDVFLVQDGKVLSHQKAGDHRPPSDLRFAHRYPLFRVVVPEGTSTLYLRYETDDIPGVRAVLWSEEAFESYRIREALLLGSTLGILVVMTLYNLIIYFFVRIRAYLYYAAYVASFLIFEICIQGLGSLYIWRSSWTNGEATLISAMMALVFALQFTDQFLSIKVHFPGIRRYLRILQGFCVFNIALTCVNLQAGNIVGILVNLLAVGWILVATLNLCARKHVTAYVMLSAWGAFLAGNSWSVLYFVGQVPPGYGGRWAMVFGAIFEVIALSLGLAQHMARLRREKTNAELSEARVLSNIEAAMRFQESLLGSVQPGSCLQLASFFQPAERIGGDWYDVATLGAGRYTLLFVGDVTGHGLSSTLLSSAVSGCIRSILYGLSDANTLDPESVLIEVARRANRFIWNSGSQSGGLMSMIMVCLDMQELQAFYLNAGHPHPILRSGQQTRFLVSRGSLLGIGTEPDFEVRSVKLQLGDTLTLYTDGVLECATHDQNLLSQRALARLSKEHSSAAQTVAAIQSLFTEGSVALSDDITVVSVDISERWEPAGVILEKSA
ncbi:MAG TPA: SpoIIE family protein phosphatase [Oligoflexus sp.]|uniref:SpoIIE family protein phosphatase n=1 Tax=Oligoflexus sp. TaxID=1971216 RepID=UPI002D7EA4A7|nr:SpoIIE family protein phosphatase [Oligoflexus sp.]HET9237504.1 SpoIIE family protein phosphatase [Oligoflexus sp.]